MRDAYIVAGVRTAFSMTGGLLSGTPIVDLAATVLKGVLARAGVPGSAVEDVYLGCTAQTAKNSPNTARAASLAAGLPVGVPGVVIDRSGASGLSAVNMAAWAVQAGAHDVVIAGGTDSTSLSRGGGGYGPSNPPYLSFPVQRVGTAAEMFAERWSIPKGEMDAYAMESCRRTAAAREAGRLRDEILPLSVKGADEREYVLDRDEGTRSCATVEEMTALPSRFKEGGIITTANTSPGADGAAAVLLCSPRAAKEYRLKPLARIAATAVVGADAALMFMGPVNATKKVLAKTGMSIHDIGLVEVGEVFAAVPLAWRLDINPQGNGLNVNGGALAIGHPPGAEGARLMVSLVHELGRRKLRFGLVTLAADGGMASATIVEMI